MNTNAKIAELILRAQNASDGGKKIAPLYLRSCKKTQRDNCGAYQQKDILILSAIELIRRNSNSDFTFSVVKDRQRIANFIVYFNARIGYERYQVSFHSYNHKLEKYIKNSRFSRWDHEHSRESAKIIYRYFVPNGKYLG